MEQSLCQKTGWLSKVLSSFQDRIEEIRSVPDKRRWGYRDRVCLAAAWAGRHWNIGIRSRAEVIHIPGCPVHTPAIRESVRFFSRFLPAWEKFPLYYYVHSGAQLLFVLKTATLPSSGIFTDEVSAFCADTGTEGLWLHLNPSAGRRVFGKGCMHLLWGREYSVDESGLHYGPAAFQQLLPSLYRESLMLAGGYLDAAKDAMIIDMYCGTGSSLRGWVSSGASAIGVEIGEQEVLLAQGNVPGAMVLRGTVKQRLPQLREWVGQQSLYRKRRLLYVNPPRTGIEQEVLAWVCHEYRPQRIAYLSCSAGTLARDLERFTIEDYKVQRIIPFDFFPQTLHVESLVLLESHHLKH